MLSVEKFNRAFPLWVVAGGTAALIWPGAFTWFSGNLITIGLGIIMLGMGLTLENRDLQMVRRMPGTILLGVFLQFTIMPLAGYSLAALFELPRPFAVGLVVVASCPGGTASNVIVFLSGANTAMSVAMTALSTIAAVALTPSWIVALASSRVEVDGWALFLKTVQVVLLPVTAGILLNRFMPRQTARLQPFAPPVAIIAIVLIVASILGRGRTTILEAGLALPAAIVLLHLTGFTLGWLASRWLSGDRRSAQAISIEVGMQNSGLGAVLASKLPPMSVDPSIPSAISSITHCLLGSAAASLFRRSNDRHRLQRSQADH